MIMLYLLKILLLLKQLKEDLQYLFHLLLLLPSLLKGENINLVKHEVVISCLWKTFRLISPLGSKSSGPEKS